MSRQPFFIVGCVRSGTTMLRNMLNLHPNLVSPEETQFFRMAEPFGLPGYMHFVSNNPDLRRHREIDGISDEEFRMILDQSDSKFDLCERYMKLFMERRKPSARRWFDKSPQNVYGAAMILARPGPLLIHIHRDPVNVVASLRIGKVMKVESLVGACNYWNESADIMFTMRRAYPRRVLEIRYEDFVNAPLIGLESIMKFLREPFKPAWFQSIDTREVSHRNTGVLSANEVADIEMRCLAGRLRYGYAHAHVGDRM